MEEYKQYQDAKNRRAKAEEWLNLAKCKDSQDSHPFSLSLAHSKIMLMRCGQHYAGGQNYWESPECLNSAILKAIEKNYDLIMADALAHLKEQERIALINCEELNHKILEEIETAKEK